MTASTFRVAPGLVSEQAWSRISGVLTAAALLIAAAIHAIVIPEHLAEWWPAAAFFLICAVGQAVLAIALFTPAGPAAAFTAVWSSVATIGLYLWSRTAGLPFAPAHDAGAHGLVGSHAGHAVGGRGNGVPVFPGAAQEPSRVESVGALDLAALGAELFVIALGISLLPRRFRRFTTNTILGCGVTLWVLRASVLS
jgi:hypothetical protein